ncbi:AraC family transcriptional regulator [Lactovum odontotermitis]
MKNEFEKIEHRRGIDLKFMINNIHYRRAHLHFDTEIIYVISGVGQVNTQQTKYSLHAGQVMVFNSCQVHEFKSESSICLLILQFPMTTFAATYPALDTIVFDSHPFEPPEESKLVPHLIAAAESYFKDQESLPLLTVGLTYLILYELLKLVKYDLLNNSQRNKLLDLQRRMQRISARIQDDFIDGISLQDLAEQEGFSKTYFSHFFKNNFGLSFQDYLTNIRCEYGYRLLLTTNENLLDITNRCGFSDIRTFNKAFKIRYGSSPKDFRNNRESIRPAKKDKSVDEVRIDAEQIYSRRESLALLEKLSKSFNQ